MLEYSIQQSKIADFGFSKINFFSNDEIYYSGFTPNKKDIERLASFILRINEMLSEESEIVFYINFRDSDYEADIRIFEVGTNTSVFATGRDGELFDVLCEVESKLNLYTTYKSFKNHKFEIPNLFEYSDQHFNSLRSL